MKRLMAAALVAVCAAGCISTNKNDGGDSNIAPVFAKDKIHIKYEVGSKTVSAKSDVLEVLGFIRIGAPITHTCDQGETGGLKAAGYAKALAYASACESAKCDHLAGVRYSISTEDYVVYRKCTAKVTGYPVKVAGVEVVDTVKNPAVQADCTGGARGGLRVLGR